MLQMKSSKMCKFQFIALLDIRTGAAAPLAPPGEELSAKLTEVECGQESYDFCVVTGFLQCPTSRRSSSVSKHAHV
jgi:hypothetical protein